MIQITTNKRGKAVAYEPSPEEISRACAEIRSHWNKREERKRRVHRPELLIVPLFQLPDLRSTPHESW